jgi:tRNA threonylcarbamoyladenosine biosynthesis protein TsaB
MSHHIPTLAAIDTSTELASVAVLHLGELFTQQSSGAPTHSATVLPMLQRALSDAGIDLADCDAFAYGCGPGSFTGVRTACGLVQGLAFGVQRKVVPVVTLLAMAEAARMAGAGDELIAVMDARMGEVYWARYRFDGEWRTITEPTLSRADQVVTNTAATVCGNGVLAYPEAFAALAEERRYPEILPHAASIARLALVALANGEGVDARDAQPLYLRNKVALTTAERLAAGVAS